MRRTAAGCAALWMALMAGAPLLGGEPPPAQGLVIRTLPGLVVDTKAREVRLEGKVCLQEGTLELMVCTEGSREHESILAVKARPSHVTFALAGLLGLKEGKPGFVTEGGAFSPPAGEVLDLTVRFTIEKTENGGKKTETREVPAWKLLKLAGTEIPVARALDWVFVGQASQDALAASDREGTVVCLSNFVEAIIDVPFESTAVNAELLYEANPEVVPPVGTPAELVIRPAGRRIAPKKVEVEVVLKKGEPPLLDGKKTELAALADAVNAMPAEVRSAVLRADADERFGRVMEVHDVLRNALMRVTMVLLKEEKKGPEAPARPPLQITVTADGTIRIGPDAYKLDAFKEKAADLLKDAERAILLPDAGADYKTIAEVMTIARDHGVIAVVSPTKPGP